MLPLLVSERPATSHFGLSKQLSSKLSATACKSVRRSGTGLLARMLAFLPTVTRPEEAWTAVVTSSTKTGTTVVRGRSASLRGVPPYEPMQVCRYGVPCHQRRRRSLVRRAALRDHGPDQAPRHSSPRLCKPASRNRRADGSGRTARRPVPRRDEQRLGPNACQPER